MLRISIYFFTNTALVEPSEFEWLQTDLKHARIHRGRLGVQTPLENKKKL